MILQTLRNGLNDYKYNEFVSEIKQFKIINNNNNNNHNNNISMEWKTEIPSHVLQIVCNQKWTVCGTIDGELYFFNNNGRLIIPPIQMEEEIVLLYISSFDLLLIKNP